jgi:Iap family predicted aminopeptidase
MKMTVVLSSPQGVYDTKTTQIDNVRRGTDKIMALVEEMPDERDGVKIYDWNKITILIER